MMDGSDLNSPAQGTRTEATGKGGESGESSGGSDDDTDNQEYKDTCVEWPTKHKMEVIKTIKNCFVP